MAPATTAPKRPSKLLKARSSVHTSARFDFLTTPAERTLTHLNSIIQPSTPASPLLSLPPEVRNRIYAYALGGRTFHVNHETSLKGYRLRTCYAAMTDEVPAASPRQKTRYNNSYRERHKFCGLTSVGNLRSNPSLLQTCRQIHGEAALYPFIHNTFTFDNVLSAPFARFLKQLVPAQYKAINSVVAASDYSLLRGRDFLNRTIAAKLTGLRHLVVFGSINLFDIKNLTQNLRHDGPPTDDLFGRSSAFVKRLPLLSAKICAHLEMWPNDDLVADAANEAIAAWVHKVEAALLRPWDEVAYQRKAAVISAKLQKEFDSRNQRRSERGLRTLEA